MFCTQDTTKYTSLIANNVRLTVSLINLSRDTEMARRRGERSGVGLEIVGRGFEASKRLLPSPVVETSYGGRSHNVTYFDVGRHHHPLPRKPSSHSQRLVQRILPYGQKETEYEMFASPKDLLERRESGGVKSRRVLVPESRGLAKLGSMEKGRCAYSTGSDAHAKFPIDANSRPFDLSSKENLSLSRQLKELKEPVNVDKLGLPSEITSYQDRNSTALGSSPYDDELSAPVFVCNECNDTWLSQNYYPKSFFVEDEEKIGVRPLSKVHYDDSACKNSLDDAFSSSFSPLKTPSLRYRPRPNVRPYSYYGFYSSSSTKAVAASLSSRVIIKSQFNHLDVVGSRKCGSETSRLKPKNDVPSLETRFRRKDNLRMARIRHTLPQRNQFTLKRQFLSDDAAGSSFDSHLEGWLMKCLHTAYIQFSLFTVIFKRL